MLPGFIAGALTVCSIDAVYFGRRNLSEVVAAHVMVIGLYLDAPGYAVLWVLSGGYSLIHQNAPLYWIDDAAGFTAHRDAFNMVLASRALPANSGFTDVRCVHDVCVAQRPGPCAALPMAPPERPAGPEKIASLTH